MGESRKVLETLIAFLELNSIPQRAFCAA
jgi:hypothetical protein